MRILLWVFILGGIIGLFDSVQASNSGFGLEKVGLTSELDEKGIESVVGLASQGDWEWFWINLDGKFHYPQKEDSYSSFGAKFKFPGLTKNVEFDLDRQWDPKYQIDSSGINLTLKPLSQLAMDLDLEQSRRNPAGNVESEYCYSAGAGQLGLDYQLGGWDYRLKLACVAKDYPEADQYTSLKLKLDQEVAWEPASFLHFKFLCKDDTGQYPNIEDLTWNYWKETLAVQGRVIESEKREWDWEISGMEWLRGYGHYRDDWRYRLKRLMKTGSDSEWSFQVSWADLNYYMDEEFAPEENLEEDEDVLSRIEKKLGMEYGKNLGNWRVELGCHGSIFNYRSGDILLTSGFYGNLGWKYQKWQFAMKIAPDGDLQRTQGFYRLKLDYSL